MANNYNIKLTFFFLNCFIGKLGKCQSMCGLVENEVRMTKWRPISSSDAACMVNGARRRRLSFGKPKVIQNLKPRQDSSINLQINAKRLWLIETIAATNPGARVCVCVCVYMRSCVSVCMCLMMRLHFNSTYHQAMTIFPWIVINFPLFKLFLRRKK